MGDRNNKKFYVVWEGRRTGIFDNWAEAEQQVTGYPKPKFKSFRSRSEAEAAFKDNYWKYVGKNTTTPKKTLPELVQTGIIADSVAVDAACAGVPGPMEYRGVHVATGEELFHVGPLEDGTNNVGEFLAIVHALELLQKEEKPDTPIYSDSYNARLWVRNKTCRTNLALTDCNQPIFDLLERAVRWLKANEVTNPILTWETAAWGEIPADFGRK